DVRTIYETERTDETGYTLNPDSDLTDESDRVKAFAAIVFDADAVARWEASQLEEPVEVSDPPTEAELIEIERAKIISEYQAAIRSLQSGYTPEEVLTFDQKAREARIILAGLKEPTPLIDALGGDRKQHAERIIAKATLFAQAAGAAEQERNRRLEALP
ncbi:MAG TPA: hypothetical protein VKP88_01005, partial [Candidatus Paceibacterota bacterium]|nr:hypothetical protein [Candidatus Paceibacterota bacterium]